MFKSGLIVAGVVGGLLLSGGSALAETWPHDHGKNDNRKIIFVCGEGNQVGHENNNHEYGLLGLETDEVLSGILGHADDNVKCSFS
ncbi:hypothetical protein E1286_16855 [Nonomuraea terrae]|uniref:Uncharacterized protein n=1 Tax=Nonomuraea terrae TaxID=2530383 RepID=A0A4R4YRF4_9ACTN|nr:hypothetical protein [Nonomuraea terrae]TDD47781.1 hypothetical protein E1286_16855 [Nonomuraea terrae]